METLGLSSTPQRSDNIFQRLFWPTIENQYDVDLVGQQGFWVCAVIGILSGILLVATGQFIVGLLTAFIFLAGACGVRERSVAAASLMATIYFLNRASSYVVPGTHGRNPLVGLVCLALLLANIRAALLSRRWSEMPSADGDNELPERLTLTTMDRIANQLPVKIWPRVKWPFFALAGLMIALTLLGVTILLIHPKPHRNAAVHQGTSLNVAAPQ